TYGPRMRLDDGRALPAFMGQAIRGEALTVFGDGRQTRSFCYIDDLIEGVYRLLRSDYNEPVNLGNPEEITILQLAQEISALAGVGDCNLQFLALPEDDPKQRQPDISLAKRLLDWSPVVTRREGIRRTYEYFKNTLKNE